MNEDYQNTSAPHDESAKTRRRVVKGLAGLPAMVTLASGSATANTSTYQCVDQTVGHPAATDLDPQTVGEYHQYEGLVYSDSAYDYDLQILQQPGTSLAYIEDADGKYQPLYADQHGGLSLTNTGDNHPVNCSCIVSFTRGHT